jgi:hypothetical protein
MLTPEKRERSFFVLLITLGAAALFYVLPAIRDQWCAPPPLHWPMSLTCGEMKFTDLALVFFTYCLVIVGWYTLRSNQRAVEDIECAYLWPGFGINEPHGRSGRTWVLTIRNTGRSAGVIHSIHHKLLTEDAYKAGNFKFEYFDGRENVISPSVELKSGIEYDIVTSMISCGYIVFTDIFDRTRKQGWKHRLRLDGHSDSLPGCYSRSYRPWETIETKTR